MSGLEKDLSEEPNIRFYSRDKSGDYKILWIPFLIFSILVVIVMGFLLYINDLSLTWILVQVWIVAALLQAAFIFPYLIRHQKLNFRGRDYSEIGIDFENNQLYFKTDDEEDVSELDEFNLENIESLSLIEISSEAYFITINNKFTFKIANEFTTRPSSNVKENLINRRDNTFIVKLISYLLINNKSVQLFGPHWAIRDLKNESLGMSDELKFNYKEIDRKYIENEKSGGGYYLIAIFSSLAILTVSLITVSVITIIGSLLAMLYLIYKYFSTPSFRGHVFKVNRDSDVIDSLKNSINEMNPEKAYILTVPANVVYPYQSVVKHMEKVLVMSKEKMIFVRTSADENLLD